MEWGRKWGNRWGDDDAATINVGINPDYPAQRNLSWTPQMSDSIIIVAMDGIEIARIVDESTVLEDVPTDGRQTIEVKEASPNNVAENIDRFLTTPSDQEKITWDEATGSPEYYEVDQSLVSGVYADDPIFTVQAGQDDYSRTTEPLADDTYFWRVGGYDVPGNVTNSNEITQVISSAPEPLTGLALSHNDGTGDTTLTWTKSTSADAAGYYLRSGDEDGVDITSATTDLGDVATFEIDNSAATGHLQYWLTCYDGDGKESAALDPMAQLDVAAGIQVLRPNTPDLLGAWAIAAGQVRVAARYDSRSEEATPATIELYSNDGLGGAMNWAVAVGSTALTAGKTSETLEVDSAGLIAARTYLVGIRAKTSGGVEDLNTNTESVLTDAVGPGAIVIAGSVV